MLEYTEYLVYGYSGPAASDYCEEIVTAKTPEYAKLCFIRSMKQDMPRWKNMGEDNVHVRLLYAPVIMRDEIPSKVTTSKEAKERKEYARLKKKFGDT
jgi:hypothetical protein